VKCSFRSLLLAAAVGLAGMGLAPAQTGAPDIVSAKYDPETDSYSNVFSVNAEVGAGSFYAEGYGGSSTIIANVEGGTIWLGHEVFNRLTQYGEYTYVNPAEGAKNEADFHATMVGHMLAGYGFGLPDDVQPVTQGLAPQAGLWTAGIATDFSADDLGSFSTTPQSTVAPYKAFFNGVDTDGSGIRKPDVINSSWGGEDPAANSQEIVALDALARKNATVAFVVSAGNSGTGAPGAPGSGYNNISVGSLGGTSHLDPSEFTSRGPADFYDVSSGTAIAGVRAAVDIAAPGESMFVAAYLGPTGSLGASSDPDIQAIVTGSLSSSSDLYFRNMDGTSFAAPVVSGGIALLKDRANRDPLLNLNGVATAMDTRVIKSVIMAGAQRTAGWDNGQKLVGGIIRTTQSLDYATGAGALDLDAASDVYLRGTRDVTGTEGGQILQNGWDLGAVTLIDPSNDYAFSTSFADETELTVSLNWFVDRTYDDAGDVGDNLNVDDLSFADLNLQVWALQGGVFETLVAESSSVYNNSEFLRLLLEAGDYGIRITLKGYVYNLDAATGEDYGLAWHAVVVPEPGAMLLLALGGGVFLARRKRRSGHGG